MKICAASRPFTFHKPALRKPPLRGVLSSLSFFALCLTFAALALAPSKAQASSNDNGDQPGVLSLTATGEVKAAPDMATITVGVVTQGAAASDALEDNEDAMRRIYKALKARDISEKDIQTSQFSVTPLYNNNSSMRRRRENPAIIGYRVSNSLDVQVRDLGDLGAVLDKMIKLGSNRINGVRFGFGNLQKLQDEARRKAVRAARKRARLYANAAGVTLGRILSISESGGNVPRPYMRAMRMDKGFSSASAVTIAPGQQSVRASISMSWALED